MESLTKDLEENISEKTEKIAKIGETLQSLQAKSDNQHS